MGKILIQHRKRNHFAQFRIVLNYPPLTGLDGIIQHSDQPNGLGGRYAAARTRNTDGSSPYIQGPYRVHALQPATSTAHAQPPLGPCPILSLLLFYFNPCPFGWGGKKRMPNEGKKGWLLRLVASSPKGTAPFPPA